MASIKLSITHRGRLAKKYGPQGLARVETALATWIARDATRGLRTVHLAIDRKEDLAPFGIAPLTGAVTAPKIKTIVDALVTQLAPDYLTLIGSGDVVPHFSVRNPSRSATDGDTDPSVPTDNPYACSRKFVAEKRESYLIPDRVVGRIPDLPGATDPETLVAALGTAAAWKSRARTAYAADLLASCEQWRAAGRDCVRSLGRAASRLLLSPPIDAASPSLRNRRGAALQMFKAHGQERDAQFYGQRGENFPIVLDSPGLVGATGDGTVVGAMCCYGGALFDPHDPRALLPGALPIPLVYLRQGAYGFLGSTTLAWVGEDEMACADWIVVGFLKAILAGASLGRALLDSKQDFVEWLEKQGQNLDGADEKTLLQFVLLGDPSIHPVRKSAPAQPAVAAARPVTAAVLASPGAAVERRARRELRRALGERLRQALPERTAIATRQLAESAPPIAAARAELARLSSVLAAATAATAVEAAATRVSAALRAPSAASALADRLAAELSTAALAGELAPALAPEPAPEPAEESSSEGIVEEILERIRRAPALGTRATEFQFDWRRPTIHRVVRRTHAARLAPRARRALAALTRAVAPAAAALSEVPSALDYLEYTWCARRRVGPITEIRRVRVVADDVGNVLRSQVLVSS